MENKVLNDMDMVLGVLEGMIPPRRASRATGWATSTGPAYQPHTWTTTKVYRYPSDDCQCGDHCSCESKPKVKFEDILDDVKQVIFNEPATIVTFSDGSKVVVKACEKDTFNKEVGLVYALVKRLYANDRDENGYLKARGLGEKIAKVLAKATDQKEKERELRRKQKAKKAAASKAAMADEVAEQAAKEAVDQIYEDDKKD